MTFDIAALSTCVRVGGIPQDRQGARGVCALAVTGSKFEGTGFEKVQMVQIHVPLLLGGGWGEGRWKGLSVRESGEDGSLLEAPFAPILVRV